MSSFNELNEPSSSVFCWCRYNEVTINANCTPYSQPLRNVRVWIVTAVLMYIYRVLRPEYDECTHTVSIHLDSESLSRYWKMVLIFVRPKWVFSKLHPIPAVARLSLHLHLLLLRFKGHNSQQLYTLREDTWDKSNCNIRNFYGYQCYSMDFRCSYMHICVNTDICHVKLHTIGTT